jgi:hypothetical protein
MLKSIGIARHMIAGIVMAVLALGFANFSLFVGGIAGPGGDALGMVFMAIIMGVGAAVNFAMAFYKLGTGSDVKKSVPDAAVEDKHKSSSEPDSDFDADAAISLYIASKPVASPFVPITPVTTGVAPTRGSFGRKGV